MKKLIILLSAITLCLTMSAQDSLRTKEVGVNFYNLSDLGSCGLMFKIGTDKSRWRFSAMHINGDNTIIEEDSTHKYERSDISLGLGIAREYSKNIGKKIDFVYGAGISLSYSNNTSTSTYKNNGIDEISTSNSSSLTPRFNLISRFDYYIKDNIIIGAEINPFISYNINLLEHKYEYSPNEERNTERENERNSIIWGLNSNSLIFSISYRF